MSSSSEKEIRLLNLSRKLGHELDEDFRRAGNKLKDILIHALVLERSYFSEKT
jgi:hypothetical protein